MGFFFFFFGGGGGFSGLKKELAFCVCFERFFFWKRHTLIDAFWNIKWGTFWLSFIHLFIYLFIY